MKKKYQSTLSYALLIYISIIVVLIALIPFDFRPPREFKIICSTNFADFITNIFFFIPVGFLFRLSRRQSKDILCLNALIFGLLLSSAIEFTQVFIPGRYTQLIDVITNGLGAWFGAILFVFIKGTIKRGASRQTFLFGITTDESGLSAYSPDVAEWLGNRRGSSTIMAVAFTRTVWHRGVLFNFYLPVQKHRSIFFRKIIFFCDELVSYRHPACAT